MNYEMIYTVWYTEE